MPLYFAYGANMSIDAMGRRCPRSKALGLARLERHRLSVMREGWLTAARDPRSAVYGVLWDLALSDVPALDRYEGLPQGLYAKAHQPVVIATGAKRALVYFGANSGPGKALPDLYGRGRRGSAQLALAGGEHRCAGAANGGRRSPEHPPGADRRRTVHQFAAA
jgi:hypothetical protein